MKQKTPVAREKTAKSRTRTPCRGQHSQLHSLLKDADINRGVGKIGVGVSAATATGTRSRLGEKQDRSADAENPCSSTPESRWSAMNDEEANGHTPQILFLSMLAMMNMSTLKGSYGTSRDNSGTSRSSLSSPVTLTDPLKGVRVEIPKSM